VGSQIGVTPALARTIDAITTATHEELADEATAVSRETVPGAGQRIEAEMSWALIALLSRSSGSAERAYRATSAWQPPRSGWYCNPTHKVVLLALFRAA
jgi:hypothetical protein